MTVGGAERNARKKRQAAQTTGRGSSAVSAARRADGDRKKVVIGVVVVVVLLGAVIAGVLVYNNSKNQTEGKDIKAAVPGTSAQDDDSLAKPSYPVSLDGGVVVVGQPTAKVTLDAYEDFLCPACRQFEETYGGTIEKNVESGDVAVRYHMLPMLNERSDPPGYSMDSANAGLCVAAADPSLFPAFHKSLFADQPEEGSRGWDRKQLADLGKRLGVTEPGFTACVTGGTHDNLVQANFDAVKKAPYLQQDFGNGQKGFGTPTIAVGEKVVDTSKSDWLDRLVKSAT